MFALSLSIKLENYNAAGARVKTETLQKTSGLEIKCVTLPAKIKEL